jgi:hypothetical protein
MAGLLRRARGILGLGLVWGAGMAGVGGIIELLDNVVPGGVPFASAVDVWPQTLAIPGFLGGAIFGIVLSIAQRRRKFQELSLPGFVVWGGVGGLMLGAIGCALGAPLIFLAIASCVSAGAAAGSLALARAAHTRQVQPLPPARDDATLP